MAIEIKQHLKLAQQLVVTPQLQQAIKLLQLSRLELTTLIQKELEENPVLEEDSDENAEKAKESEDKSQGEIHEEAKEEDRGHEHNSDEIGTKDGELKEPINFDWENYISTYNAPGYNLERSAAASGEDLPTYENTLTRSETLQEHLLWQLGLTLASEEEQNIGSEIIGNINEDGYLMTSVEDIASELNCSVKKVEMILSRIQEFDPNGVAARDLKECLLLQTKQFDPGLQLLIAKILENHLPNLEKHQYKPIAKDLAVPIEKI